MIYFIDYYNSIFGKNLNLTSDALGIMKNFNWKGNVRQLENFCESIVPVNSDNVVNQDFIKKEIKDRYFFLDKNLTKESLDLYKEEESLMHSDDVVIIKGNVFYKKDMEEILRCNDGNRSATAKALEISRTTLWKYLKQLNI